MEWLLVPLGILGWAVFMWVITDGPQKLMRERRLAAEARERTEELRLRRAELENGKSHRG